MSSGAGPRPLGTPVAPADAAAAGSSPKAKKKEGSAKKKAKSSAASSSSSAAAAAAPAARVDHLSAASASMDPSVLAARQNDTALARANAFPALYRPYNAEEDEDEEIDEEKMKEQMQELMKEETVAPRPLSLEIIRQRCLPKEVLESGDQKLIDKHFMQLERVYLDGQSLNSIDDCFDLLSHTLTHVYLQRNELTTSQGFSSLKNLRFLVLAHNHIRQLEGLADLPKLQFLDISHNNIDLLDTGSEEDDGSECQLPEALVVLKVAGNPFAENEDCTEHIVTVSPYLKTLDGVAITRAMRRGFGLEVSDGEDEDEQPLPASTAGDEEEEDDDEGERAADALHAQAEEMRKRSELRTAQYDSQHDVSQSTTQQDRKDALTAAAAAAAGKK